MRRHRAPHAGLLAGAFSLLGAVPALAIASSDNGPWLTALSSAFVVMDMSTGDLDGDGKEETVVCYREATGRTDQVSGIAILTGKAPDLRPAFHVQLEALCEKVRVNGRKLGILFSGNKQLVWTYGEQVKFRSDKGSFHSLLVATSSSFMDGSHKAEKAVDGDLFTSWAEGTSGTGLGQTLTIKLPRPMNVGVIGIYGGNGAGPRAYFDSNRLHRGSIVAKTEADLGDSQAGFDFASLGIESMGDRQDFTCENKPQLTYVRVGKKGVVELQFRIESVYLGDKKDDTHIAEIEIVPVLGLSETLDRATKLKPKEDDKGAAAPRAEKKKDPDSSESVRKLDASGRSLIEDDDL
jgi:hypothetical protein